MAKNITIIQGDTYDLGFRMSNSTGPVNLLQPPAEIVAYVMDTSGTRTIVPFEVVYVDKTQGQFYIHLSEGVTRQLRGKYIWYARYRTSQRTLTLATGNMTVKGIG